ncbi:MAG TPA: AmmeMemoRadiSam system radical SAM enzyme [Candidatus Limnocylindrales bacterium]|nr:AmmeMemoRadiSam system radical SAM enzyme [Candidatus Limnocylindrales bacterium]
MAVDAPPPVTSVPSVLAESLPEGSVRCAVCAHRCLVRPGRRGICGVRENVGGELRCHAYGAVAAVGLDPIEKKPLFHVDPGSLSYSIATTGCPFHCRFCQNWEIAQAPRLGLDLPADPMTPGAIVDAALRSGARSIACTYVEPTVFLEYALDIGRIARAAGMRNLFITDGYATPEAVGLLATVLDAANVDLKSFDDAFYRRLCGARLGHVLEAIEAMRDAGIWLEITTLVIPGWNDSDAELRALASWLVANVGVTTPWHVSRFFPAHRMLDVPPTPAATLLRAAQIGRAAGLRHVYVGNAPQLGLEDTHCAGCDRLLIERQGYRTRSLLTDGGECPRCGRPLEGIGLRRGGETGDRPVTNEAAGGGFAETRR